jgi:hypothetical protein
MFFSSFSRFCTGTVFFSYKIQIHHRKHQLHEHTLEKKNREMLNMISTNLNDRATNFAITKKTK